MARSGIERRIAQLIRTLRDAEREIDALTGGQLDAVVDTLGRPYLLGNAQQHLRESEDSQRRLAAMQAAILNGVPACVALLDTDGVIVSVNDSWRQFGRTNGFGGEPFGVGLNYLTICERASGARAEEAVPVAEGIRAVLSARAEIFELEYPCHAPDERRWFRLLVTPLHDASLRGAVVTHFNVTDRKLAELASERSVAEERRLAARLIDERARLVAAQSVARIGSWETDLATFDVTWSEETYRIFGVSPGTFIPTHASFLAFVHPEDRANVDAMFQRSIATREAGRVEHRIVLEDWQVRHAEERWHIVTNGDGAPIRAIGTCQDVTERHNEAAARAHDQMLLRVASTLSRLGWFSVDLVNGERRWSEEVLAIFELDDGRTPSLEEAIAFYAGEDRARIRAMYDSCVRHGTAYDAELRIVTRRGKEVWVRTIGEPVRDAAGRIVGLRGAFQDITERKSAERELREAEERFRLIANTTNDAIYDWDLASRTLWCNEGFEQLFGYRLGEVEPAPDAWESRLHTEDRNRVVAETASAIRGGARTWAGEYRFRCLNGDYKHVHERRRMLYGPDGVPVRVIGGMSDLTSRKQSESRLARQAALLDAARDAIVVRDLNGRISYWNKGAERVYGWMAQETLSRPAEELLGAGDPRESTARTRLFETGQWEGELLRVRRDGKQRAVDVRWTLLRDERGTPNATLEIATDVTERKQLESDALRAQRLDSLGTLAGGIAHDLANVLAPIQPAVSMIRLARSESERLELLHMVEESARLGSDIVKQVLVFARGSDGARRSIRLHAVAKNVEMILRESFPKNITVRVTIASGLWPVMADATQMQQVLMNLCLNARDAMPDGGTLSLNFVNATLDETYAAMNPDARAGRYVAIAVRDTGAGISDAVKQHLFEPFFTTKEPGKGTGLGLSTVYSIVRNHGGFVTVYSQPGDGSRFVVHLPAEAAAPADEDTPTMDAGAHRGGGELVLIVDDEEAVREISKRTLERFGYRVLLAQNGAEAVSLFAQNQADVDVVLTDMMMPVMDGPALAVALRSIEPNVRLVGFTGLASHGGLEQARKAGVSEIVSKPFTAEVLLDALHRVLHHAR